MHHTTTLVVDFDDTLAITLNRNWDNAAPNIPLIEKLNSLYDEGWTIHIVTARGNISCNGDHDAADKKYRAQIEKWLVDHNVSYTDLSFQKKLAAYYIDDKGITPEDFLNRFGRFNFGGGLSGATVYYDSLSDAVYKTAKNTKSVIEWYTYASPHYNVPKIYSVIGDTIKMENLEEFAGCFSRILEVCYSFRNLPKMHVGLLPTRYVDRCLHRISDTLRTQTSINLTLLENILYYAASTVPQSFSHGDFSVSNIMSDKSGHSVYLIDPINDPTLLSSWVVDLAKLYMSIGFEFSDTDERIKKIELFAFEKGIPLDLLRAHEIGHLCRVYPYADDTRKVKILDRIIEKFQFFLNQATDDKTLQSTLSKTYVPR